MSGGKEPFTGAELRRFFERRYSAKSLRQTGSHLSMELPDGRVLRCTDDKGTVTKVLMQWNAKVLGVSYAELRAQLAPIQNKNKPRFRPRTHPPARPVSRKDALSCLDELIGDARQIKHQICNGDRDPSVYRRIHDAARSARGSLRQHNRVKR